MAKENDIRSLREELKRSKEEYFEIKGRIKELEEQEKHLKDELERVREHLSYYQSLVSDMKKRMKGMGSSGIFDRL